MQLGLEVAFDDLEGKAVLNLENNKTTAPAAGSLSIYPFAGGAYTVATTPEREQFYSKAKTVMKYNKLSGRYIEIASLSQEILQNSLLQFGTNNSQNLEGTRSNNVYDSSFSLELPAAGAFSSSFLMPEGSVGVMNWNDMHSRMNTRISEAEYWSTIVDPVVGWNWGVKTTKKCVDKSATLGAGNEAVEQVTMSITTDVSYLAAQGNNLIAGDSPIVKFNID